MAINLYLAVIWLGVGLVFLLAPEWIGKTEAPTIAGIRLGWFGIALAAYNLVRYWSVRSSQENRRLTDEGPPQRHITRPRPTQEPDPTFDFTEPPNAANPDKPNLGRDNDVK